MKAAIDVLAWVQAGLWVGLAYAAISLWLRRRSRGSAWIAATFGTLGFISLIGRLFPDLTTPNRIWLVRALLATLMLFPYFLFRFAMSFKSAPRWLEIMAAGFTLAIVGWSFLLTDLPPPGAPRPQALQNYVLLLLVQWAVLLTSVISRLWRAGRGQPAISRKRMRTLAIGAGVLMLTLLVSGISGARPRYSVSTLVTSSLGLISAPLFWFGFAPPQIVRVLWRRSEETRVRAAERGLMTATSQEEVAAVILERVAGLTGGRAAVLLDDEGKVRGSYGLEPAETEGFLARSGVEEQIDPAVIVLDLHAGKLVVEMSPYSPFFASEEADLLSSVALVTGLAQARVELFSKEREARLGMEKANRELEAFLYSVSHDLKSPLITVSGYLDYLKEDFGDNIPAEGLHYLERMEYSLTYMQALISDLLELSRIGRIRNEEESVDLAELARSIASDLMVTYPSALFKVGDLPVLQMDRIRARQLVSNLLENAVSHAGKEDVIVELRATRDGDGDWKLEVFDDGDPIPAEYREKVFDPFQRIVRSDRADPASTGIGLSICRKIVESYGGRIWVDDTDKGADIAFTIPAFRETVKA